MYQLEFAKKLEKDLEKIAKSGKNIQSLYKHLENLQKNPYKVSKSKTGDLDTFRALEWGKGYRIVFKIIEESKQILIVSIDKHDDAYKKAKRRNK